LIVPRDLGFQPLFQVLFGVHFLDLRSMRARIAFPPTTRYNPLLSSTNRIINFIPPIRRRDSEEAYVPLQWLWRADGDALGIRMGRIDEVVRFSRHNGRGHTKKRGATRSNPLSTSGHCLRTTERTPVRRRPVRKILYYQMRRNFSFDHQRTAEIAALHKAFQHSQGQ